MSTVSIDLYLSVNQKQGVRVIPMWKEWVGINGPHMYDLVIGNYLYEYVKELTTDYLQLNSQRKPNSFYD